MNPAQKPTRFLIIDGHAYAYRAFHAIPRLSSPSGKATNAIFGFIRMIGKLQASLEPSHWVVVWDGGLAAERLAALPEYKAQRPPMPDDLALQLDEINLWLRAMNIATCCQEGVEADDWIAALARRAVQQVDQVLIASSDKDFMQLVTNQVGLVNPNDKSPAIWSVDRVREKSGVEPSQIVDWLSLIGDSIDNIAGVPGIGAKTATRLLMQFGSCALMYSRLAEVAPPSVQLALRDSIQIVTRNQELIRLRDQLPVEFDMSAFVLRTANADPLRLLYAGWGFHTLLRELDSLGAQQELQF